MFKTSYHNEGLYNLFQTYEAIYKRNYFFFAGISIMFFYIDNVVYILNVTNNKLQ